MSEFIHHFGVDWKLLLAQAVNFIILLIVLKKFAYGPLMRMLDERKRKIAEGLAMRDDAEKLLRQTDAIKEETITKANAEAFAVVSRAETTANQRQNEIMATTEKKVEGVVADACKVIDGEKAKMKEEVYRDAEELVRSGIAAVLGRMPQDERDEVLIREAIRELKNAV